MAPSWFNTSTPPSSGYIFALSIGPDGRLYYNHWGSISGAPPAPPEGYNPVGSSVIPLDEWTHVAATWGPTGTHLYVNGQEDGYTPFIAYPALNPTTYLYLNQWGQPGSGDKTIEELAISSVQRPAGEIQARFEQTRPVIMVDLDLDPDTLNLQNKGNYITGYIEFPEGVDPGQIQGDTILLEGVLPAEDGLIGDHDADGVPELMLKFSRPTLIEYLSGTTGEVTLTVRGLLSDGVPFEGTDAIWVIQPNR